MKDKELIRLCTAGSVDDGKSTLIGRLLYDTDQVYDDQLAAIKRVSDNPDQPDLSLLTDGLAAEREQKITIDVAYRYFSTRSRRFIVADVPGHEQYTKNMVTGASHAQVGLILVDARKGLLTQSKRHLFVASLLRVPHIAVVINKMDLVEYREYRFNEIKEDIINFAGKLEIPDLQFIPASAYAGDMVVRRGEHMPWYTGRTVIDYLNTVEVESDRNLIDFRFPVQQVMRPDQDTRVYTGTIESGSIREGEDVLILPSKQRATVKAVSVGFEKVEEAVHPQSIGLQLNEERDISRGDMIVRPNNVPEVGNSMDVMVSWFDSEAMVQGKRYIVKQTTNDTFGTIQSLTYELDIDALHRKKDVTTLSENGIGKIHLTTQTPLLFDLYRNNRFTGSLIFIDPDTYNTVGAGVITAAKEQESSEVKNGSVIWFTGLSGSGKTTIADALATALKKDGNIVARLDGDILREAATVRLGFDERDRRINVDMAAFAAQQLAAQGITVICSFISPYADQREKLKSRIPDFIEAYVSTPIDVCEDRDPKGLYKKVRDGEIKEFTGISSPYEPPTNADIICDTTEKTVGQHVEEIVSWLKSRNSA